MVWVAVNPLDPVAADALDHEQERAVRALREGYAAGACTLDELSQHIAAVYAAETPEQVRQAVGRLAGAPAVAADSSLEQHLVGDERLLWVGRPDPKKRFAQSDLYMVPFSLMWGGFAIFWETTVILSGAPVFFALWGIPFVVGGLYMIAGRFFYKAWQRRRTLYAVTDRRALRLVRRRSGDSVDAVFLDAVPAVHRELRPDGSGSVIFGPLSSSPRTSPKEDGGPLAFEDIPNASHVAELVTELRRTPTDG
jgi:DUF1707 SHOCT-like domain